MVDNNVPTLGVYPFLGPIMYKLSSFMIGVVADKPRAPDAAPAVMSAEFLKNVLLSCIMDLLSD